MDENTSSDHGAALQVSPEKLRQRTAGESLGFATTADLEPLTGLIGQERALAAIEFGIGMDEPSFNMFVLGPPGTGKTTALRSFLEAKASASASPHDWVYVNNFDVAHKPKAIGLPTGRGSELRDGMVQVIDDLRTAIPALFEGDDYQSRRRAIDDDFRERSQDSFEALSKQAEAEGLTILKTPAGFAVAPTHEGAVIKPEVFAKLPEAERQAIEAKIEVLQGELTKILEEAPRWQKSHRERIRELNEEMAEATVREALTDIARRFADIEPVQTHLKDVERDLIENVALFLTDGMDEQQPVPSQVDTLRDARFRRYMVNALVSARDNGLQGAPIVDEDHPTLGNLLGRIERIAQMGALVTDFLLIKPGALHQANGGYLLLDARKALLAPLAWEALKRTLRSGEIAIESPADELGLVSTVSLEPERIPLKIKVILFGDRQLYYMLAGADPEFSRLFKVAADFDETLDRQNENVRDYARLLASIVVRHKTMPIDASGVARMIDEGARIADDNEKLTLRIDALADIVREANYWAEHRGSSVIAEPDISRAVREQIHRQDRLREKSHESIGRDIVLIDTDGAAVGQVNGLSVLSLGQFAFGRPTRITARTRMGAGRLIDIEREVELGGPLHSKGVMILRGFLEGRYAHDVPLSLSASLVFEQSYGGVDGDSASSTELYALLSSLSGIPLKQGIAVTGSVNQHGRVQAIGGANEKIEGFFDVCKRKGLTGHQGVIIPQSNVLHLMLREDVVEAVEAGKFAIYAVSSVDEGMQVLTGREAGERGVDGRFAEGTINHAVETQLIEFAEARRRFGAKPAAQSDEFTS